MARRPGPLRERLEDWAAAAALGGLSAVPEGLALAVGEGLGALAWRLARRRRRIALANLERVFGAERDGAACERLGRESFRGLGRLAVELARLPRRDRRWLESRVELEGLEQLARLRRAGRPVLLVTAHFGAWELLPLVLALVLEPIAVVVRPADNPRLERRLAARRTACGTRLIPKDGFLRASLDVLSAGGMVGMLVDQHVPPALGVPLRFLGQDTWGTPAPAILALRTGAALIPIFAYAAGRGRHRIRAGAEIDSAGDGDRAARVAQITRRLFTALGDGIAEQPASWLWSHRRFREQTDAPPAAD